VPAADEVFRLHRGDTEECRFFQSFCDDGHYRGASPDSTRQGIYAVTPSGVLLESINTTQPGHMRAFLERALTRWEATPRKERLRGAPVGEGGWRWEEEGFPADGLVLRVNSRDLPRPDGAVARGWRGQAWNQDYLWYRKAEARSFLAAEIAPGAVHEVPRPLVDRLVRFHFVDNVRGQTLAYDRGHVERAELKTRVVKIKKGLATVEIEGHARVVARGRWRTDDDTPVTDEERGAEGKLAGTAVFDIAAERFVEVRLVAACTRWGATQYNERHDDKEPNGMGVAFTLDEDEPAERVAPAYVGAYGWR
jgi:hypothetical protein